MALARVKVWSTGEEAKSAEWNAEFDNLVDNVYDKGEVDARAPVGALLPFAASTAPSGPWLLCDAKTIGNGSSGGTSRANADTQTLFELLWNNFADAELAVSGGRGASATADFNNAKTIVLPDLRGRTVFGKDDLGGTAANRITSGSAPNIGGTVMGRTGGVEEHQLVIAEMPAHDHDIAGPLGDAGGTNRFVGTGNQVQSASTGGDAAHTNMPPTFIAGWIIRY